MLGHFTEVLAPEARSVGRAIRRGRDHVELAIQSVSNHPELLVALDKATKSVESARPNFDRIATITLWHIVVLVTCVEAYLQDILADAAAVDHTLMASSEQMASYHEVLATPSIEALSQKMRERWAKRWLSDGGPARWIERFKRMGMTEISPTELSSTLELVWRMRHVIVHRAGRIDANFRSHHPRFKPSSDKLRITLAELETYMRAAFSLLEPIERFALARWPALATSPYTSS